MSSRTRLGPVAPQHGKLCDGRINLNTGNFAISYFIFNAKSSIRYKAADAFGMGSCGVSHILCIASFEKPECAPDRRALVCCGDGSTHQPLPGSTEGIACGS